MFKTEYVQRVFDECVARNKGEKEFQQAVQEVLETLEPVVEQLPWIEEEAILERLVEPERFIQFRVAWQADNGTIHVNRGYRVQHNSAIGPYKGGLRFHESVNASVIKFLGFEQTFKNSLTTLPLGGGKGGSDFNPKGKSDAEIMRFCQAFITELAKHIGPFTDIPAGDIGVGAREVGYMYGQYKRLANDFTGTFTGKGLEYGGSLLRPQATGYGLCYYTQEAMRRVQNTSFEGKRVIVSGSGNVAIHACEKAQEMGATVVALSDSNGFIFDENGIDLAIVKDIKEKRRARISEYVKQRKAEYHEAGSVKNGIWSIKCDIALPCATQNELDEEAAKALIANGCKVVCEGANMPCTPQAIHAFMEKGLLYGPGKAANAGGVATSGIEMIQNSQRHSWPAEQVDEMLKGIMINIVENSLAAAQRYGRKNDLMSGANIAGFEKLAKAIRAQGVI